VISKRSPLDALPATAKARLRRVPQPAWIPPMLAPLTAERFSREGWLFEPKWDGERCLVFRHGRTLNLFSRNRKCLNEKYPEIAAAFYNQPAASFIADGEIVALDNGLTRFVLLQQRMQIERPTDELLRRVPVWMYLFDLSTYLDHYDARSVPSATSQGTAPAHVRLSRRAPPHGALREGGRSVLPTSLPASLGRCDREKMGTANTSRDVRAIGSSSSAGNNRSSSSVGIRSHAERASVSAPCCWGSTVEGSWSMRARWGPASTTRTFSAW